MANECLLGAGVCGAWALFAIRFGVLCALCCALVL